MIRHLIAIQYDSRQKDAQKVGLVHWRQWKRESEDQDAGVVSMRSTGYHDEGKPRMVYTKSGERVKKIPRTPRYDKKLRSTAHKALEKLRVLASKVAGVDAVKVGYAPGSPNVDVWFLEGENLVHRAVQDPGLHKAAHKIVEHVAKEFADPDQPVSVWERATE